MSYTTAGELIRYKLRQNKIKIIWITTDQRYSEDLTYFKSPGFHDGQKNTWSFHHYQVRELRDQKWRISLVLSDCVSPVTGYCTFSILDADQKEIKTEKKDFRNISAEKINYDFFEASEDINDLIIGDRLRIICRLAVVEGYDPSGNLSNTNGLSRELNNLFTSERFSDITLCAGGREFKAHRSILAARSPVFRLMFSTDLQESKSGRVKYTDISAEVLEEMLKFIYTGKSVIVNQMYYDKDNKGINQDFVIELLQVADRYQLDGLRAICEDALADSLTEESAYKIMALSSLYHAGGLAYQCIEFINSNSTQFIKQFIADGSLFEKSIA